MIDKYIFAKYTIYMNKPRISVCIPAYKQPILLERCLHSLRLQEHAEFEVIVTDDSPDDSVADLVRDFRAGFTIRYEKNPSALGSPGNWNAALALANGGYVKILHHDDWLRSPNALATIADLLDRNPNASMAYSATVDVYPNNAEAVHQTTPAQLDQLNRRPETLLLGNFVGAPSGVTFRKYPGLRFDPQLKWLVDIDFYLEVLKHGPAVYIPEPLVNIGLHEMQVTNAVQHDPAVVLPEWAHVLGKDPRYVKQGWKMYDLLWRMVRNFGIRRQDELVRYCAGNPVPAVFRQIVRAQGRVPAALLRLGPASKAVMSAAWVRSLWL